MLKALSYDEMRGTYSVGKMGSRTQLDGIILSERMYDCSCFFIAFLLQREPRQGWRLLCLLVIRQSLRSTRDPTARAQHIKVRLKTSLITSGCLISSCEVRIEWRVM